MGITIEEYLAQREPCAVCDSTGNTEYCITHMLSRFDNCLFYNAVILNSDPYDNNDTLLLQNVRASIPGNKVLEYYMRAEPLVKKFKSDHGNDTVFWTGIYDRFIHDIILAVRAGQKDNAVTKVFAMLDTLESENPS
jgi:hypothetical protein